jgi:GT2 family glycosyltransferase
MVLSAQVPVSVIVPIWNGARYFARLKASLFSQGAAEIIIVIDDGSRIADVEAVFGGLANVRVLTTSGNIGTALARNVGVQASEQAWVTFLDQDDWWPEGFLREVFVKIDANVVGCDSQLWSEADGPEPIPMHKTAFDRSGWTLGSIDRTSSKLLLRGFPMLKVIVRRSVFDAVGGYRRIHGVEDFDLVWRLVAVGERVQLLREPATNYLVHSGSTTGSIQSSRLAFERAQRSWLRVWGTMVWSSNLPAATRWVCLRSLLWTVVRLEVSVMRKATARLRIRRQA